MANTQLAREFIRYGVGVTSDGSGTVGGGGQGTGGTANELVNVTALISGAASGAVSQAFSWNTHNLLPFKEVSFIVPKYLSDVSNECLYLYSSLVQRVPLSDRFTSSFSYVFLCLSQGLSSNSHFNYFPDILCFSILVRSTRAISSQTYRQLQSPLTNICPHRRYVVCSSSHICKFCH